ncbi:uncharacterized protein FA14DRAFT_159976 [Meira miltonrushii]|uniref:Alpha/beta-hydrolase n=1 Tax=Meira miltonrushii TaxID=1280837 RepID=A0A316VL77_9BASI|nr:uncharacterized protein FA14DRAFT_159976 [Meira miltonrushii]PWN38379.1 hypothetical protein FA14DRAFT_159976 [Meira miltonrushii]
MATNGQGGGGIISGWVATFLRVSLLPVICIGAPLWPIVGLLCAVPVIGIFAIPLFLLLTLLLLYSVAWFSYLLLAQADPPASSKQGTFAPYLPFLPYSPLRCLKINWAALLYASSAVKVALPAVLDWSYRRVMVLGTQGGGGIVKENILYGSSSPNKRLDIYLPPSAPASARTGATSSTSASVRNRKHSTNFAEPLPTPPIDDEQATPRPGNQSPGRARSPVVIVVPSPIPPLTWTQRRKTYLQLALRLRRMGYCVIVPDISWYPEGRIKTSIVDLRLVLRWAAANCKRYGGDERQIYLLGHGMSAHLAMLTLTQEAVVLSREGFLHKQSEAQSKREQLVNWDNRNEDDQDETITAATQRNGRHNNGSYPYGSSSSYAAVASTPVHVPGTQAPEAEENAWVDEPGEEDLPPGAVMNGNENIDQLGRTRGGRGLESFDNAPGNESGISNISFPSSSWPPQNGDHSTNGQSLSNIPTSISNGLRRVEIYEPEINVPPIAGIILLAGVFDVIKCFRNESDRGVEHLSVLRRSCGPSHTSCLLHSPAHLLYAAKNILDTSLLPPRFLLVHGGKDAVVDVSQSTLLKTLLSGIGVENVKLRAYRELGHVEAVASLFLGMGKASTRYSKQILSDISDFISAK